MKRACISFLIPLFALGLTSCAQRTTATRSPVYVSSSQPGMIPAGTTLAVRTDERIEVTDAVPGRTYSATITRAIVDGTGRALVPQGSPAQLTVVGVESPGGISGGQLSLAIQSVTVNGTRYTVESLPSDVESAGGLGANRRTATMVGGGAALGTLIGAVAGGGSGAAIGAAIGAAGGAAAQVLTQGDTIRVPAETVLEFRLDQPIRLAGYK